MRRPQSLFPLPLLVAADLAAFFSALALVLWIRYGSTLSEGLVREHLAGFGILFAAWSAVFALSGLYGETIFLDPLRWRKVFAVDFFVSAALGAAYFYFLPALSFVAGPATIAPKTNLFLVLSVSFGLIFLARQVLVALVRSKRFARTALLIGSREGVDEILGLIREFPHCGYRPSAVLVLEESDASSVARVEQALREGAFSAVILDTVAKQKEEVVKSIALALASGIEVLDSAVFTEHVAEKIPLGALSTAWFLEHCTQARHRVGDIVKRALDIALSCVGAVLCAPLILLVILAVKAQDRGPVFYEQVRVGRRGAHFVLRKFRTMRVDAEAAGPQWAQKKDPRVTPVGRLLRATHLDEFPQLLNILRGEMSFVGPRPERPEFTAMLEQEIPFHNMRLLVRPGLAGWAQLNYPYTAGAEAARERLQYDLYYLKNRSTWLDLAILARTIKVLL